MFLLLWSKSWKYLSRIKSVKRNHESFFLYHSSDSLKHFVMKSSSRGKKVGGPCSRAITILAKIRKFFNVRNVFTGKISGAERNKVQSCNLQMCAFSHIMKKLESISKIKQKHIKSVLAIDCTYECLDWLKKGANFANPHLPLLKKTLNVNGECVDGWRFPTENGNKQKNIRHGYVPSNSISFVAFLIQKCPPLTSLITVLFWFYAP